MANKTYLDAVNAILQRVGYISGDSGLLTSLTDSARQAAIDVAKQVINVIIAELYSVSEVPMPSEQKEATITLATSTRAYTLATDLLQMRWPLIDKTNTQFMHEAPGGYNAILQMDPEENDTGIPYRSVIRPTDGKLYVYPTPTSTENGRVYTYQYDKSLELTSATDQLPFNNTVFNAIIPAMAENWKLERRQSFDINEVKASFGLAARLLSQRQQRDNWSPRG